MMLGPVVLGGGLVLLFVGARKRRKEQVPGRQNGCRAVRHPFFVSAHERDQRRSIV